MTSLIDIRTVLMHELNRTRADGDLNTLSCTCTWRYRLWCQSSFITSGQIWKCIKRTTRCECKGNNKHILTISCFSQLHVSIRFYFTAYCLYNDTKNSCLSNSKTSFLCFPLGKCSNTPHVKAPHYQCYSCGLIFNCLRGVEVPHH